MAVGPLGIFDSGLGGLTVVRAVSRALPAEPILYFGDTARLPYGNKSPRTVTRLAMEALRFLEHFHVKAFVVACNSASAVAMNALRQEASMPVIGVVEAGAHAAAARTRSGRIGVIGTRATVDSRCDERELQKASGDFTVIARACPLFVPLVEEGWIDEDVTRQIAARYLADLKSADVDTLILGCTHYPLLASVIQDEMGPEVQLVDSGDAMAVEVTDLLQRENLTSSPGDDPPRHRFFVSDQPEQFEYNGRRFLGNALIGGVEPVDQSDVPWYDRWADREEGSD